jgi:hypothetical protein
MGKIIQLFGFFSLFTMMSCDKWEGHHEGTDALNSLSGIWMIDTLIYYKGSDDTIIGEQFVFDSSQNYFLVINETLDHRNKKNLCNSNLFNANNQFFVDVDWVFYVPSNGVVEEAYQLKFIDCKTCNNSDVFYKYLEGVFTVQHIKKNQSIFLIQTRYEYDYTEIINIYLTKVQ